MPEPKAAILNTPFDVHGGPDGRAKTLLDFSVNSNPFGPPVGLLEQLTHTDITTYPDPTARRAKQAAAAKHARSPAQITFGNGTAELIHRLATCYLTPSSTVVIAAPTFGEYLRAVRLQGATGVSVNPYQGLEPNLEPLITAITQHRPTLVFVCHPNNPTGHAWSAKQLETLAQVCAEQDALLVLDLAYLSLSDAPELSLPERAVQLYSLTKSFTIPGVRVGYVVASAEIINTLERSAPPWQTSAHAQAAAIWALSTKSEAFLSETVSQLLSERDVFQKELEALNVKVSPTRTTFFLCEVGGAAEFRLEAERAGLRVRDATSFGLARHIRLATRLPAENKRLLEWWVSRG